MPMTKAHVRARTKAEATHDLLGPGEPAHPKWTKLEVKSRIMELRAAQVVKLTVTAASSRVVILSERMKNRIGLAGKGTKGDMLRKLREAAEEQLVKSEHSLVTVGKHVGKSFDEVRTTCPR